MKTFCVFKPKSTIYTPNCGSWVSNWTDGGTTDWTRSNIYKHSGSYSAIAGENDNDLISDNLNTTNYNMITISFWYMEDDIDADDDVYLQLYNGTSYTNKFELDRDPNDEDKWHFYGTVIDKAVDPNYFRSNFRIKFEATSLDSGERLWIDDVLVTAR